MHIAELYCTGCTVLCIYFCHAFKATTGLYYLMMTDNGNKNKLKASCLCHSDQACCCLLWFYMRDPQDLQAQSHAASFVSGSTEPEKVDSYWKSQGFFLFFYFL